MAPQVTALLTDILQPSYIWLLVTGKSSNVIILSARYEAICLCSYVLIQGYVTYRFLYRFVLWPRYLSPLRHVPTAPGAKLIMGHAHLTYNNKACLSQREWTKQLGPVVRFFGPFGSECLFFLQAEPLHQILSTGWFDYPRVRIIRFSLKTCFSEPAKPAFVRQILRIIAGDGLLAVTGHEHRLMRKAMNPAFSIPNLMARMCDHCLIYE